MTRMQKSEDKIKVSEGERAEMVDRQITNKKFIQGKSKTHEVETLGNGIFKVTSGESDEIYTVAIIEYGATCTCPWGQYRKWAQPQSGCSHVISAYRASFAPKERAVSMWTSKEDADRQHRHQIEIGDGVIVTTRKKEVEQKSEAQILKELGF